MQTKSKFLSTNTGIDSESADFWQQHIAAFKQTKMNQSAYCRKHNLNYHCFKYRINKLSKQSSSIKAVPIVLKNVDHSQPLCTLKFADDKQLLIHDQSVLLNVLSRLL